MTLLVVVSRKANLDEIIKIFIEFEMPLGSLVENLYSVAKYRGLEVERGDLPNDSAFQTHPNDCTPLPPSICSKF